MAAGAAGTAGALQELTGEIPVASATCLNERPGFGIANLFVPDARALLKSDDDDELLVILPFSNTVHLSFVEIESPEEHQPRVVKLFKDRPAMTFPDVAEITPEVETEEAKFVGTKLRIKLQTSIWRNTTQVTLFFGNEDLDGDELMHISSIRLFGTVAGQLNTADLKGGGMADALAGVAGGGMPMGGEGPGPAPM